MKKSVLMARGWPNLSSADMLLMVPSWLGRSPVGKKARNDGKQTMIVTSNEHFALIYADESDSEVISLSFDVEKR